MVRYTSSSQTKITEFDGHYELRLDPDNRWILLGKLLPWDEMAALYCRELSSHMGAGTVDPRQVIGTIIVKHKLGLSDTETLDSIGENPYMQVFLGLDAYRPGRLFSPTLLVEARKRLGKEAFDAFTAKIVAISCAGDGPSDGVPPPNKGRLKIDATVADQYIRYPNDLGILDEVRRNTEDMVDLLFELLRDRFKVKPRTYRKVAHQRYVSIAKKKKKRKAEIRKEVRFQLNAVERNLGHIERMMRMFDTADFPLPMKYLKRLWVAREVARQQRYMYDERTNTVGHRIVSPSQPHVRPIVRGKQGRSVEFGAKLGLSLFEGHMAADTLSWDAYNESGDLRGQAEAYKVLFGHWPELIQADKIYATNANRKWCRENGIRLTATPKGRPVERTRRQKAREREEYANRNAIEGRIGNAKQVLSLNQIRAKLRDTSESWIGATLFVLNLSVLAQNSGFTF